jgi:hypothetical protein
VISSIVDVLASSVSFGFEPAISLYALLLTTITFVPGCASIRLKASMSMRKTWVASTTTICPAFACVKAGTSLAPFNRENAGRGKPVSTTKAIPDFKITTEEVKYRVKPSSRAKLWN